MTALLRSGIYLEDNPPARAQWAPGRPHGIRPVIVVHTAECGTDLAGPDPKAENVAAFIKARATAGSYHLVGDTDSIIQLVRFGHRAYHDRTGSNDWSIGISLAMNADDWPALEANHPDRYHALVDTAGRMAAIAANWMIDRGVHTPQDTLLTRTESEAASASGFISHARRDPRRRTDPGPAFPWDLFFARYVHHLTRGDTTMPSERNQLVERLQMSLIERGLTDVDPEDPEAVRRYTDGILGPVTLADTLEGLDAVTDPALADLNEKVALLRAELDRADARARAVEDRAQLWDDYSTAVRTMDRLNQIAQGQPR